jgi:hypothetical protein
VFSVLVVHLKRVDTVHRFDEWLSPSLLLHS